LQGLALELTKRQQHWLKRSLVIERTRLKQMKHIYNSLINVKRVGLFISFPGV